MPTSGLDRYVGHNTMNASPRLSKCLRDADVPPYKAACEVSKFDTIIYSRLQQNAYHTISFELVAGSLGGDCVPAMANSKSSPLLKMRRTLMDSYNETVRSAPKVKFLKPPKSQTKGEPWDS